jgi:glycosyltransferase involved in cell wall biosynthesis
VISYHFPPILSSESIVVGKLFGALAGSQLAEIDLVTVREGHSSLKVDRGLIDLVPQTLITWRLPSWESWLMYKFYSYYAPWWTKIPDNLLIWRSLATAQIRRLISRQHYDFIIAGVNPLSNATVALRLKKEFPEQKLVFLINDPILRNPFIERNDLQKNLIFEMEKNIVRNADLLVFPCIELRDFFMALHHNYKNKTEIIPHCYEPRFIGSVANDSQPTADNDSDNFRFDSAYQFKPEPANCSSRKIVLAHTGAVIEARNFNIFIDVLRLLPEEYLDKIEFSFVGHVESELKNCCANLPQIKFSGIVSYKESLEHMSRAGALILLDVDLPKSFFFPGKLPDYLAMRRPIIAITPKDSCTARIIQDFPAWVVAPDDPQGLAEAIVHLVDGNWPAPKGSGEAMAPYAAPAAAKRLYQALAAL